MDIYHKLFLVARHEQLHKAPLLQSPDIRILDVGTGTGIWAIDMAELVAFRTDCMNMILIQRTTCSRYPTAEVRRFRSSFPYAITEVKLGHRH